MTKTESNHGGKRPGAGRKPGQGAFRGGRPVSTRKLKIGDGALVHRQTEAGPELGQWWQITGMSRTEITWTVTNSTDGGGIGDTITMRV